jgi:hypothetical protein
MPASTCSKQVLTGQDGMIAMKPPGTLACLLDFTDFPVPVSPATFSLLKIPENSDFRVSDPVTFTKKGTADLDSALTEGTVYYIKTRPSAGTATISATIGGNAIAFAGSGGVSNADTPGEGNHIEMSFASAHAMCDVPSVTLTITRGQIDTTAIPCKPSATAGGPKLAKFRRRQPGFADGSGTLTLRLNEDTAGFGNRIIQGSLFNDQGGCVLKAYFSAIAATGGAVVDDTKSLYCEVPINLLGFDTAISQDDNPTEFSINFDVADTPVALMGLVF